MESAIGGLCPRPGFADAHEHIARRVAYSVRMCVLLLYPVFNLLCDPGWAPWVSLVCALLLVSLMSVEGGEGTSPRLHLVLGAYSLCHTVGLCVLLGVHVHLCVRWAGVYSVLVGLVVCVRAWSGVCNTVPRTYAPVSADDEYELEPFRPGPAPSAKSCPVWSSLEALVLDLGLVVYAVVLCLVGGAGGVLPWVIVLCGLLVVTFHVAAVGGVRCAWFLLLCCCVVHLVLCLALFVVSVGRGAVTYAVYGWMWSVSVGVHAGFCVSIPASPVLDVVPRTVPPPVDMEPLHSSPVPVGVTW